LGQVGSNVRHDFTIGPVGPCAARIPNGELWVRGLDRGQGTIKPERNLKTSGSVDLATQPFDQEALGSAPGAAIIEEVPKEHGEPKDQIVAIDHDMTGKPRMESGIEAIGW
jgi:hypothetical protein